MVVKPVLLLRLLMLLGFSSQDLLIGSVYTTIKYNLDLNVVYVENVLNSLIVLFVCVTLFT